MSEKYGNNLAKSLHHYIIFELPECRENEIFEKSTMFELGEFYFQRAIGAVEDSNIDLLQKLIAHIHKSDQFTDEADYYLALCNMVGIHHLPKSILASVKGEYQAVFEGLYISLLQKIDEEISSIDAELLTVKDHIKAIKTKPPSLFLTRDLTTDENSLYESYQKCTMLRTSKEMLQFSKTHTRKSLMEFGDFDNAQNIQDILCSKAFNLAKEKEPNIATEFAFYKSVLNIAEDHVDRPYALFFKVKLYTAIDNLQKLWQYSCLKSEDERVEELNDAKSKIPSIDDLNEAKSNNPEEYLEILKCFIATNGTVEVLSGKLAGSICLRERKDLLFKSLDLYSAKNFAMFIHVITLQIEGLFGDFLKDSTTFNRFTNLTIYPNDVLKDKIQHLQDINVDIYPEAIEYFMYYFNNIVRNRIAHGNFKSLFKDDVSVEIFAHELLLDLNMLVHMLSRNSETDKMYRFVYGYKSRCTQLIKRENPHFGSLFNDINGTKIISDYDFIEKARPMQIAYWLVNPYYEKIYESTGDKSDLIELRTDFLSEDFWEYVLIELSKMVDEDFGYHSINMEMQSVVKGLFKCDVNPKVKNLLGKVNGVLQQIQYLKDNNSLPR